MSAPGEWARARRLLCVRLDAMGDVLMTTPAMRALRESAPGRHVTLLTSRSGAAIARMSPVVDGVVVYDAPWLKATEARGAAVDLAMIRRLRSGSYDGAVIFTVYSQSPLPAALLCFLADLPLRAAHCRENPYRLLSTWLREREPDEVLRHEVQRQLDLAAALGATTTDHRLALRVDDGDRLAVRRRLDELRVDRSRPWAVLHPGASAESRRYPPAQFAAAARTLVREHGWQLVVAGAPEDRPLAAAIVGAGISSLAGALSLGELAALLEAAPLAITNNSGPAHIAAAVGTPLVTLYALTNPQHTPWGVASRVLSHDVPCRFCYRSVCPAGHHDCLRAVEPARVVAAALELWAERGAGRARSTRRPDDPAPRAGAGAAPTSM